MMLRHLTVCCLLLVPSVGFCARPMVTDDARTVDPRSCQLESWVKLNQKTDEYWALPACNLGENFEVTYGASLTRDHGESETSDVILQFKTLLRPLTTNAYGIGLVAGHVQHPNSGNDSSMIGDAYTYIPASFSFLDDSLVVHTNLGILHARNENKNKLTWGLGSETKLTQQLQLIAEVYGDNQSRAFHQVGLRYWIVPDRVQLDTTYGNRFSNNQEERWFSFGLRLLSPRLW